jgi:predicted NBD/HSP70 family sugar kinase
VGVHARPGEIHLLAAALDGNPLGTLTVPMPAQPEELPEAVLLSIRELMARIGREMSLLRAVGFTISGLVSADGDLAQSPNLGWRDVKLRKLLSRTIRVPLYIGNDSNSAAIAEQMFGHGAEGGDFLYIESGSGVGGGLVLDGSLYRGAVGYSGEIGHTKVVLNGRQCRCGGHGCLSAYVSDAAIVRHLQDAGGAVRSADEIIDHAASGDPLVLEALDEVGTYLGAGLANLINLLNPPMIVLGGNLARFAPYLDRSMRQALEQMCLPSTLHACEIRVSSVSLDPIPRGAIALALEGCTSLGASEEAPW